MPDYSKVLHESELHIIAKRNRNDDINVLGLVGGEESSRLAPRKVG